MSSEWKLVPIEPTDEMLEAASVHSTVLTQYLAMVEHAPIAPEVPDTGGLVEPTVFIDEQGVAQVIEGHGDAIKALFAAMPTPPVGRKVLALVPAVSRAEAAAELSRLQAKVELWEETANAPPFTAAVWQAQCFAATEDNKRLREALTVAIRAADLALFVIRKQGVMPNSSWEAGFESDMKVARAALTFGDPVNE